MPRKPPRDQRHQRLVRITLRLLQKSLRRQRQRRPLRMEVLP